MHEPIVPPGKERAYTDLHFAPAVRTDNVIRVSGHIGRGEDGRISIEPITQFREAFANVAGTLAAAGAGWADVVEMTTYHVGLREHLSTFISVRDTFVSEPYPAWTAVGVSELVAPDALIEIAAVAITPRWTDSSVGVADRDG